MPKLEDFKKAHGPRDISIDIRKGLTRLGDGFEYTEDFAKSIGVAPRLLKPYHELFKAHIVSTRGRNSKLTWWGTTKAADAARKALG